MDEEDSQPQPARISAQAAFDHVRKEIAARNEATHKAAHKLRAAREKRKAAERRERDMR